ncbi:MAG: hypothetical protein FD154_1105 [Elusimicrobia bacterium]|nr:MAG: hypothetical protein FD154_1105 [Elusimicrobiota bacterium]
MKTLFEAAGELQRFLAGKRWKFCFIGGIALQRWGEPRLTLDADISLLTGFGGEEEVAREIIAAYRPRINDAVAFARDNRVLPVEAGNGARFDISLAAFDFEEEIIDRASYFDFSPSVRLLTCSAEDLAVMKAFACRDKDLADLRTIVARQGAALDKKTILERLKPLAAIKPEEDIPRKIMPILGKL